MEKKNNNTAWNILQVILASPWFWSAVASMGIIIWTWLKDWFGSVYAPLTIPAVLVTVAAIFFIINQIRGYRRKKNVDYQSLIEKWLLDSGTRINRILEHNEKILWIIEAISQLDSNPIKIAVFTQTPATLTLGIGGVLDKVEQDDLARYTSLPNSTLIEELQMEMNRLGIGYTNFGHPLASIELTHEIPLDDTLNQVYFLNEFLKMRHAIALCTNTVTKYKKLHPLK